jgi:hypothetical protein
MEATRPVCLVKELQYGLKTCGRYSGNGSDQRCTRRTNSQHKLLLRAENTTEKLMQEHENFSRQVPINDGKKITHIKRGYF